MARRTRRSQPSIVANLSKGPMNEEDTALQSRSTNTNTTLQRSVDVQDQMVGPIQNNLRGASWRLES